MYRIAILSASVRTGRSSHNVALFFEKFIRENNSGTAVMIDLKEYNFPVFEERLSKLKEPSQAMLDFAAKIKDAEGVIIVTPEYNGGYPASLKNVVDLLYGEWRRKPIGLVTVSNGQFGGTQVMTSLLFTLWKIGAWVVPAMYRVSNVQDVYDAQGNAKDEHVPKFATSFINELVWCMEANRRMQAPA